ncbi:MAG: hypothetical protein IPK72_14525 [Candidatus Eisenbacteria bacterium]|nr:hypothetical protein [Candidatus Eisenbacteria bacterium]
MEIVVSERYPFVAAVSGRRYDGSAKTLYAYVLLSPAGAGPLAVSEARVACRLRGESAGTALSEFVPDVEWVGSSGGVATSSDRLLSTPTVLGHAVVSFGSGTGVAEIVLSPVACTAEDGGTRLLNARGEWVPILEARMASVRRPDLPPALYPVWLADPQASRYTGERSVAQDWLMAEYSGTWPFATVCAPTANGLVRLDRGGAPDGTIPIPTAAIFIGSDIEAGRPRLRYLGLHSTRGDATRLIAVDTNDGSVDSVGGAFAWAPHPFLPLLAVSGSLRFPSPVGIWGAGQQHHWLPLKSTTVWWAGDTLWCIGHEAGACASRASRWEGGELLLARYTAQGTELDRESLGFDGAAISMAQGVRGDVAVLVELCPEGREQRIIRVSPSGRWSSIPVPAGVMLERVADTGADGTLLIGSPSDQLLTASGAWRPIPFVVDPAEGRVIRVETGCLTSPTTMVLGLRIRETERAEASWDRYRVLACDLDGTILAEYDEWPMCRSSAGRSPREMGGPRVKRISAGTFGVETTEFGVAIYPAGSPVRE